MPQAQVMMRSWRSTIRIHRTAVHYVSKLHTPGMERCMPMWPTPALQPCHQRRHATITHAVLLDADRDRTMISQGERQQDMSSQMWCSIRTSFSRVPSDMSTHALSRWAFCTREVP